MRKHHWLLHTIAILSVTAAAQVAGAATAAAAGANRDTMGINTAAGTVTTHSGKVISGITFVSKKDLATVKEQQAKSGSKPSAGINAVSCLNSWVYITAGGTNAYWKPLGTLNNIYATGNRSADYWNQQFLPCYVHGWAGPEWAFLANASGKFVDTHDIHLRANTPMGSSDQAMADHAKFYVCHYDGYWIYVNLGTNIFGQQLYVYRDPADQAAQSSLKPLNGNHLFYIDSPIMTGTGSVC